MTSHVTAARFAASAELELNSLGPPRLWVGADNGQRPEARGAAHRSGHHSGVMSRLKCCEVRVVSVTEARYWPREKPASFPQRNSEKNPKSLGGFCYGDRLPRIGPSTILNEGSQHDRANAYSDADPDPVRYHWLRLPSPCLFAPTERLSRTTAVESVPAQRLTPLPADKWFLSNEALPLNEPVWSSTFVVAVRL